MCLNITHTAGFLQSCLLSAYETKIKFVLIKSYLKELLK